MIGGWREDIFVVSKSPMKIRIPSEVRSIAFAATLPWLIAVMPAIAITPQYQIYDIGVINSGDTFSQGFGVSPGGVAVGRSIGAAGSQAFTWTLTGGISGLSNLARRRFCSSESANESGAVVSTAAPTLFRSVPFTGIWQNAV